MHVLVAFNLPFCLYRDDLDSKAGICCALRTREPLPAPCGLKQLWALQVQWSTTVAMLDSHVPRHRGEYGAIQ